MLLHTHTRTHTHTHTHAHTHTHTHTHTRTHTHTHTHTHAHLLENPYPDHEVVTVKLNEKQVVEEVANPTAEGKTSTRKVLLETVFEMNYTNGRWRKLQYKRVLSM